MRRTTVCTLLLVLLSLAVRPALGDEATDASGDSYLAEPAGIERLPATELVEDAPEALAEAEDDGGWWGFHRFQPGEAESSWYGRIEYFLWKDLHDGYWISKDEGAMPTIGHFRRWDRHRTRLEFFGSQLQFDGVFSSPFGYQVVPGHSNYIGGRAEYDLFLFGDKTRWDWLVGLGTRIWDREITVTDLHQLWVTLYPYLGVETRRDPNKRVQFYYRTRIGLNAFTYERASTSPATSLYPTPGLTSLIEFGFRGQRLFLSGYLETFAWNDSPVLNGRIQSDAVNLLAGMQAGWFY